MEYSNQWFGRERKCPFCGSSNVWLSRKKGTEKLLGFLLPYSPHRCRDCHRRFGVVTNPFKILPGVLVCIFFLLAFISLAISFWSGGQKTARTQREELNNVSKSKTALDFEARKERSASDKGDIKVSVTRPVVKKDEEPSKAPGEVEKTSLSANKAMPGAAKDSNEIDRLAIESPPPNVPPDEEQSTKTPQQKGFQGISNEPPSTSAPVETVNDSSGPSQKQQVSPAPASDTAMPQIVAKKMPRRKLKGVHPIVTKLEVRVMIKADGPIENYKAFPLDAPPRLVLDVNGRWKNRGPAELTVADQNIKRIRIGEHEDKLRIVMDLNAPEKDPPSIAKTATGLTIILTRSPRSASTQLNKK